MLFKKANTISDRSAPRILLVAAACAIVVVATLGAFWLAAERWLVVAVALAATSVLGFGGWFALSRRWSRQTAQFQSEVAALQQQQQTELAALSEANLALSAASAEATRELDQLCAAVSHDLRSPLLIVHGFGELLIERYGETLPPKALELAKNMIVGAAKMEGRIQALLTLSQVSREALQIRPINLCQFFEPMVRSLNAEHPALIRVLIGSDKVVMADHTLLTLAFNNLLDNAVKFSSRNVNAAIELGISAEDETSLTCFVRDHGVGFDERYMSRLFTPFQRLHKESEFAGVGMGLATANKIIARLGGSISASASVNEGATFYVTLTVNTNQWPSEMTGLRRGC